MDFWPKSNQKPHFFYIWKFALYKNMFQPIIVHLNPLSRFLPYNIHLIHLQFFFIINPIFSQHEGLQRLPIMYQFLAFLHKFNQIILKKLSSISSNILIAIYSHYAQSKTSSKFFPQKTLSMPLGLAITLC